MGGAGVSHGSTSIAVKTVLQGKTEQISAFTGYGYLMIALEEVILAVKLTLGLEAGHHLVGSGEDAAVTLHCLVEVPQIADEVQFFFFFALGYEASRTYPGIRSMTPCFMSFWTSFFTLSFQ